MAAERIGVLTRIPVLSRTSASHEEPVLHAQRRRHPSRTASRGRSIRRMFVQGSAKEVNARLHDLEKGKSVLDFVNDSAKRLQKDLGPKDRDRLDQYFTSVRDLETQLQDRGVGEEAQAGGQAPEPKDVPGPTVHASKLMFDLIRLALETDSTRLVTLFIEPSDCIPTSPAWSTRRTP